MPTRLLRDLRVYIGLPWLAGAKGRRVPRAKGRRIRYLDDFFGNLECKSVFLGFLVQKVDGFDT